MRHKRELLRPENASSWEEFQARAVIGQQLCRDITNSWTDVGLIFLSVPPGFGAMAFWYVVAHTYGAALVTAFLLAIVCTALFAWPFGAVMRTGVRACRRYAELDRLRAEWRARAWRGEIPASAPDGPKVWRDDAEAGTTGA